MSVAAEYRRDNRVENSVDESSGDVVSAESEVIQESSNDTAFIVALVCLSAVTVVLVGLLVFTLLVVNKKLGKRPYDHNSVGTAQSMHIEGGNMA